MIRTRTEELRPMITLVSERNFLGVDLCVPLVSVQKGFPDDEMRVQLPSWPIILQLDL